MTNQVIPVSFKARSSSGVDNTPLSYSRVNLIDRDTTLSVYPSKTMVDAFKAAGFGGFQPRFEGGNGDGWWLVLAPASKGFKLRFSKLQRPNAHVPLPSQVKITDDGSNSSGQCESNIRNGGEFWFRLPSNLKVEV